MTMTQRVCGVLRRQADKSSDPIEAGCLRQAALHVEILQQSLDNNAKDAARYRWLRAGSCSLAYAKSVLNDSPHGIDASIDVAMAKERAA